MLDVVLSQKSITDVDADTVIVHLLEDNLEYGSATVAINSALGGMLDELVESGEFTGKSGQSLVIYTRGAMSPKRVILVGLGQLSEFTVDSLRQAVASGVRKAREHKSAHVATALAGTNKGNLSVQESAQALTEGALLGLYTYHGQKSVDAPEDTLESFTLLISEDDSIDDVEPGVKRGKAFASGTILARELVNLPPNICTPDYLANRARAMAETAGLKCDVLGKQQISALKMGAFLGVAQASETPPRFIIMEYNADRAKDLETVVLVGKGVTFDTGGYSIKTRDGMVGMKSDMGGGAAVIGAMNIIAALELPLHVVGLVPAADNMISGKGYRPQDVLTASNGKTIEVISTDAEGRLLLADALVYAKRYDPAAVVDIATLTGSCVVALGPFAAGLFSTDEVLRDVIVSASNVTGERVWPLPLYPEYTKMIKSDTADVKNSGGRLNGVGTSAAFLQTFVDYPTWAHIDMAGMVKDAQDNAYVPSPGATGYGARLLAQFVVEWAVARQAMNRWY